MTEQSSDGAGSALDATPACPAPRFARPYTPELAARILAELETARALNNVTPEIAERILCEVAAHLTCL